MTFPKWLKTALGLGAALALFPTAAHAEFVTTAIAVIAVYLTTTYESALALYAVLNFVVFYVAIPLGLSYVTSAIMGKPGQGQQNVGGIQTSLAFGDTAPRTFGVGRFCTAGSLIYANTFTKTSDKPNEFLVLVIGLSDMPIDGLEKFFVGDTIATYSTSGHTTSGIPGYSIAEFENGSEYYLYAKFYDGTQTAVDHDLNTLFVSDPNYPWPSTMIGTNLAYVIITLRYNPQLFPGMPGIRFQMRGVKLYDPRADSTVGGSGSQRWDTPTTWAWTENPAVVAYNLLRGVSPGGRWMYGLQTLNPLLLPYDNWVAAMNGCDVIINDIDGNPEAQFRCGFEIVTSVALRDMLEELKKSCQGRMVEIGGVYKFYVGAAPAYVMAFDDSYLLSDQSHSFDQFPSLADTVNAITAKYPEPAQAWNVKDAPPLYDAVLEADDGNRRLPAAVVYNAAPFASQVQRLMASALLEARKFRKHAIIVPPQFWPLEPGDIVRWNSAKNGYIDKDFRVETFARDQNLNIMLGLLECDPADYDFNPDADYFSFVTLPIMGVSSTTILPPIALTVTASFRALVLDWINIPNYDLQAVEIWRSSTSSFGGASLVSEVAPYVSHWVDEGLESISQRWYWIRYRNKSGAFSAFHPSSAGAGATNSTDTVGIGDITAEDIDAIMRAEGLEWVQVVDDLAAANPAVSHQLYLTTDKKLYRWDPVSMTWTAAVPTVDLTGQITEAQITDASITVNKLGTGSVTTIKIGDSQVSSAKLADGSVITAKIGASQVTTTELADGSVITAKIGDSEVTTNKLATGSVTTVKIGDNQVTTDKIGDSQVTTAKIGDAEVTTDKISTGAVTTIKVGDLQITETKLADGSITGIKIGNDTITTVNIDDNAITAPKIAANAVVAGKIAAGTIVAADISAHTITAGQIAADTITAAEIAAHTITAAEIAAGTITANEIAAATILTSNLFVAPPGAALNSDPGPSEPTSWTNVTGGFILDTAHPQVGPSCGYVNYANTNANNALFNQRPVPIDYTKTYRFHAMWANDTGTGDGQQFLGVNFYDVDGNAIIPSGISHSVYLINGAAASPGSWVTSDVQFGAGTAIAIPSNARTVMPFVLGNWFCTISPGFYFNDVRVEEATPGTLIKDGAISTDKIAANAITSSKILADAITAGKIDVGAIDASHLIVDDIIVTGHLVDLNVTTGKIATAAATIHADCEFAGPTTPSTAPSSYTTLASVSFSSEGSPIIFGGVIAFLNNDNTNHGADWRLLRSGTQIWPPVTSVTVLAFHTMYAAIAFSETPGAGTYTYAIQWKSAHANNQAFGVFLNIDEIKR